MQSVPIRLVVGLGNPGSKYETTRHNAGFWFLDQIARDRSVSFKSEKKFQSDIAHFEAGTHRVWLMKPTTFMNNSGQALRPFADYYQIALNEILVVHDEIDLPAGVARYKRGGGHGGHNGLRDIFAHMAREFWRLRIGVGHPGSKDDVINYVMKAAGKAEQSLIDDSMANAFSTLNDVWAGDMEAAMRELHSMGT